MKLKSLQSLRSNWNFPTIFRKTKVLRECDIDFNVENRRKKEEVKSISYFRTVKKNVRVGRIKRLGKTTYNICGIGDVTVNSFSELKNIMSKNGYTGGVMGAIKFIL